MSRSSFRRSALVAFALIVLPAAICFIVPALARKPLDEGAREEFSRIHTCPLERIEVRRRADLTAWDLRVAKWGRSVPPDEIARDPDRLALWTKGERESQERMNEDTEVYEVRGCGLQVLWACDHPTLADGGVYITMVSCEDGGYPEGSQKPW